MSPTERNSFARTSSIAPAPVMMESLEPRLLLSGTPDQLLTWTSTDLGNGYTKYVVTINAKTAGQQVTGFEGTFSGNFRQDWAGGGAVSTPTQDKADLLGDGGVNDSHFLFNAGDVISVVPPNEDGPNTGTQIGATIGIPTAVGAQNFAFIQLVVPNGETASFTGDFGDVNGGIFSFTDFEFFEGSANAEIDVEIGGANGVTLHTMDPAAVGSSSTATVTVRNEGTADLTLVHTLYLDAPFTISPDLSHTDGTDDITIPAGGTQQFTITFAPTAEGTFTDTLEILNTDASETRYELTLLGRTTGVADPFQLSGDTLTVTGTSIDDVYVFRAGTTTNTVTLNGVTNTYDATQVTKYNFQGGAGNDSATVYTKAGADTATLQDSAGTITHADYLVKLYSSESITVSGDAADVGKFYDGAGNDVFYGRTTSAIMIGASNFDNRTYGFGKN